ncbi:MAG: hypothetical protein QF834_07770, partial [Candidatus Thalassarchaeaceae archaeon]|nr:hypothetical protein [Candidatus Thalassarchaeaceae archaeon]
RSEIMNASNNDYWVGLLGLALDVHPDRPRMRDWMGDWMDRMEFLEPWGRICAGPRVRTIHPVLHSWPEKVPSSHYHLGSLSVGYLA